MYLLGESKNRKAFRRRESYLKYLHYGLIFVHMVMVAVTNTITYVYYRPKFIQISGNSRSIFNALMVILLSSYGLTLLYQIITKYYFAYQSQKV